MKARLTLFVGVLLISLYPILVKLNDAPSLMAAFYRMAIPCFILVPYLLLKKQFVFPKSKATLFAMASGIFIASDISIWNQAIKESSISEATLLVNLSPVWVGLAAYFFLKNKPKTSFWIGTFIALVGMVIVVGFDKFYSFQFNKAFFYAIAAGMFYAGYIVSSKKALNEIALLPFFTLSLLTSSIFLLVINVLVGNSFSGFSTQTWLVLLAQGILIQLVAWLLINFALSNMRATRVSLSLLAQAFFATVFAFLFLGEPITAQTIIGGIILLGGIAFTFKE
ncbi:MAG: DMT family transporter [Chitinophagales bacterium]|nr:DMT family transporter [Chitinophagales bacterium]